MDTTTTPSVPAPPATRLPAAPPSGPGPAPSRPVRWLAAAHSVPALASLAVATWGTIQWAEDPDGFLSDLVLFLTLPVFALVAPLLALTVNLAAAYADHVFVMASGRLVADGPPEEVLTPDVVREVYGVAAVCGRNPITGRLALHLADPRVRDHPMPAPSQGGPPKEAP